MEDTPAAPTLWLQSRRRSCRRTGGRDEVHDIDAVALCERNAQKVALAAAWRTVRRHRRWVGCPVATLAGGLVAGTFPMTSMPRCSEDTTLNNASLTAVWRTPLHHRCSGCSPVALEGCRRTEDCGGVFSRLRRPAEASLREHARHSRWGDPALLRGETQDVGAPRDVVGSPPCWIAGVLWTRRVHALRKQ